MHELGITQHMLQVALERASQAGLKKLTRINLVLGDMSDFTSDSVQFYFDSLSRGTPAEGAELRFRPVSGSDLGIEGIEGE